LEQNTNQLRSPIKRTRKRRASENRNVVDHDKSLGIDNAVTNLGYDVLGFVTKGVRSTNLNDRLRVDLDDGSASTLNTALHYCCS
jgi:hypothetical protein